MSTDATAAQHELEREAFRRGWMDGAETYQPSTPEGIAELLLEHARRALERVEGTVCQARRGELDLDDDQREDLALEVTDAAELLRATVIILHPETPRRWARETPLVRESPT